MATGWRQISTVLVGKPTTCRCWSRISSPIPSQATKLNILKAPAIGAQGTPISSESAVPLRRTLQHTQIPGSRFGDSPRRTHSPRNQPPPPGPLLSAVTGSLPLLCRGRAAGRVGEGSARARAAPAQTMPRRAERAPGRSDPAPANTHPFLDLQPKRRARRAPREGTREVRERAKPRGAAPPRGPSDPGARGSTRLGGARPSLSALHVSSRGGAGRARRRRRARPRGRDLQGCGRGQGSSWCWGAGQAGAGVGGGPDSDPSLCCRTAWGVWMSVLAKAPSFIIFVPRNGEFHPQV